MSGKTLNYNKVEINKNKFHGSKQSVVLDSVKINRIVTSDKSKHSEKGFKYFTGYANDGFIRPLCIILPQMSEFIKYFNNSGKNMSLMIKDDKVLIKFKEIWGKVREPLGIKLHSKPIYDDKYIKTKVR